MVTIKRASEIATNPSNGIMWLEKAETGKVTIDDIKDALEEFARLFKAGFASKAETLTLARAFPENRKYTEAAGKLGDDDPMVIGGPASVEVIDREGHLITTDALKKAFIKFMQNFRTRNAMVLHSDVQVGWALPAYITRGGQIFKSGVDDKGLFFICEVRDDTKIADKVREQISSGRLKSYSIAGSATKVQNMQKGTMPYMQVDDMELAEVTVCEKGVNQEASFELLKAEVPQTGKINKDQCGYRDASPAENKMGINCGHCKYYNTGEKTCDLVSGDIQPNDYCRVFAPCEEESKKVVIVMERDNKASFKKSLDLFIAKEQKDPLKSGESFATLNNFAGREEEHHQLLREYGFPSEQPSESSRYVPVVETETDDNGIPRNIKPPWVVNEAGQDLGDRLDEDSPDYNKSAKAKSRASSSALEKMADVFDVEKAKLRPGTARYNRERKKFAMDWASRNRRNSLAASGDKGGYPTTREEQEAFDRDFENWRQFDIDQTRGSQKKRLGSKGVDRAKRISQLSPAARKTRQDRVDRESKLRGPLGALRRDFTRRGKNFQGDEERKRQGQQRENLERFGPRGEPTGETTTPRSSTQQPAKRTGGGSRGIPQQSSASKRKERAQKTARAMTGKRTITERLRDATLGKIPGTETRAGVKERKRVERRKNIAADRKEQSRTDPQSGAWSLNPTKKASEHDEHRSDLRNHLQTHGHAAMSDHMDSLAHVAREMVGDGKTLPFTVHPTEKGMEHINSGKGMNYKDFHAGRGDLFNIKIHPDYENVGTEITNHLGDYMQSVGAGSSGLAIGYKGKGSAATPQPAGPNPSDATPTPTSTPTPSARPSTAAGLRAALDKPLYNAPKPWEKKGPQLTPWLDDPNANNPLQHMLKLFKLEKASDDPQGEEALSPFSRARQERRRQSQEPFSPADYFRNLKDESENPPKRGQSLREALNNPDMRPKGFSIASEVAKKIRADNPQDELEKAPQGRSNANKAAAAARKSNQDTGEVFGVQQLSKLFSLKKDGSQEIPVQQEDKKENGEKENKDVPPGMGAQVRAAQRNNAGLTLGKALLRKAPAKPGSYGQSNADQTAAFKQESAQMVANNPAPTAQQTGESLINTFTQDEDDNQVSNTPGATPNRQRVDNTPTGGTQKSSVKTGAQQTDPNTGALMNMQKFEKALLKLMKAKAPNDRGTYDYGHRAYSTAKRNTKRGDRTGWHTPHSLMGEDEEFHQDWKDANPGLDPRQPTEEEGKAQASVLADMAGKDWYTRLTMQPHHWPSHLATSEDQHPETMGHPQEVYDRIYNNPPQGHPEAKSRFNVSSEGTKQSQQQASDFGQDMYGTPEKMQKFEKALLKLMKDGEK